MNLSIIIPTKNRYSILLETLLILIDLKSKYFFEIIVVNDNDNKLDLPEIYLNNIKVVDSFNRGAAYARNLGVKNAKYDSILFLDDDILMNEETLLEMYNFIQNNKNACINPNWILSPDIQKKINKTSFGRFLNHVGLNSYKGWVHLKEWEENKLIKVPKLSAFCLMMNKRLFNEVGGFDERFKFASVEDDEFSFRLKNAGAELYINTTLLVYHNEKDRIDLLSRLNRLKINAHNRYICFKLGFEEYKISYSYHKKIILMILSNLKILFFYLIKLIPENKKYDSLKFKFYHLLIAIFIYEGYHEAQRKSIN
jgi:GT2 family glycosyltransferase